MKHIKTIIGANLRKDIKTTGCGECQTSCQSACKTSCTVANQDCVKK
ncbi:MAG: six-cysteine ranthipeptide SCIFF [Clostridiales bacterium]|nr:six-cysteine ranthipeptide SCIFF [Clostridiales bacterium]